MNDLAGFSEWMLALLPRLFLYPGGLWLLAVIIGLKFVGAGRQAASPRALLSNLFSADLLALATAWSAVALLPNVAATPHTFPTDRLALSCLLAISLLLEPRKPGLHLELAVLAAVIVPVAGQSSLLNANIGASGWLSLLAVLLGMAALVPQATNNLALAVRLIGWLGLASAPLWALPRLQDPLRVLLAFTALILAVSLVGRLAEQRIRAEWSTAVVWSLAALSLLAALLLPA